jgi:DNA-binding MarR family transcriptional regulator
MSRQTKESNMQNLTDLEQKVVSVMILAICHPERSSGYIDSDFRALAKGQGITSRTISGVVSSLVQKGIVNTMEDEIENDVGRVVKCQYYSFISVPDKQLVESLKPWFGSHENLGV